MNEITEDLIRQKVMLAKRVVADLEEPFRTEAFKTVLVKLLQEQPTNSNDFNIEKTILEAKDHLPTLNRTNYNEINLLKTTLEKSCFILKNYRDDFKIDGLTSSQIAVTLTETFRIKTSKEAVSMALMNATNEVDRTEINLNGKKTFVYKLMQGGESLLTKKLK